MIVRFHLSSGLEIIGLPTENFYGGHWDLGPTWNYAVLADHLFLVDCGRYGQGKKLGSMLASCGISGKDLQYVLISHSHEDHDGGLAELLKYHRVTVKAHAIYDLLIRQYPEIAPPGHRERFPAKCWHCQMPESFFSKHCLGYHGVLQDLTVEKIGDGENTLGRDIRSYHLPGHSPDCLAVMMGSDAIIVGDIVLPGITPWPTREAMFEQVSPIIRPYYPRPDRVFGLRRYIKSLKKLADMAAKQPDLVVLPAHRLYYKGRWNNIELGPRVKALLQHHMDRCAAILKILQSGPKTEKEIAIEHFEERLLKGFGSMMAANEVISHCELLIHCGDLVAANGRYVSTGSSNFEDTIAALKPDA